MPVEPREWTKVTRRSSRGGAHVFVAGTVLNRALKEAGFSEDTANLEVSAVALKDRPGKSKIILCFREERA